MTTDISSQEEFYNNRWRNFKYADNLNLQRCVAILDGLHSLELSQPRICDLGCGAGWMAAILGQFGPTTGLDLSSEAIDAATDRYRHVTFEHVILGQWTPPADKFDVVVSQEVIEHLADQPEHIRTIRTMLRSSGYMILTTPNASVMNAMREENRPAWTRQPIEDWLTVQELERIIRSEGMRIVRRTTVALGFGETGLHRILNSTKAHSWLKRVGVDRTFDNFRMRAELGLHTVVIAQRV